MGKNLVVLTVSYLLICSNIVSAKTLLNGYRYINDNASQRIKLSDGSYKRNASGSTNLGPLFFTLHPEIPFQGPYYDNTLNEEQLWPMGETYTQNIYGLVITSAVRWMEKKREIFFSVKTGEPKDTFWAFLLGALSIPHHESQLLHFRKTSIKDCNPLRNSMQWTNYFLNDTIYETKQSKIKYFEKHFYGDSPVFPDCQYLKYEKNITQLIVSNADAGLMQINIDVHDEMRQPDALFNLYKHIDYAMQEWMEVFPELYAKRFSEYMIQDEDTGEILCTLLQNPYHVKGGTKPSLIVPLAQGLWAGKHNQGNIRPSSVCRPQMENDHRDDGFEQRTLYSILDLKEYLDEEGNNYSSVYDVYMNKNSIEFKSLLELRNNIASFHAVPGATKTAPNAIEAVVKKYSKTLNKEIKPIDITSLSPVITKGKYYLDRPELRLFLKPGVYGKQSYCGRIVPQKNQYLTLNIKDEAKKIEKKIGVLNTMDEYWAQIEIPRLRYFEIKWNRDAHESCKSQSSLWALASIGNEKLLQKTGYYPLAADDENTDKSYYAVLNDNIESRLSIRSDHYSTSNWLGALEKSENLKVKVLQEWRSDHSQEYPYWLQIEYKPGSVGWVAADFMKPLP